MSRGINHTLEIDFCKCLHLLDPKKKPFSGQSGHSGAENGPFGLKMAVKLERILFFLLGIDFLVSRGIKYTL